MKRIRSVPVILALSVSSSALQSDVAPLCETANIEPLESFTNQDFGSALDLFEDTLAIGADGLPDDSVHLFVRDGLNWYFEAEVRPSDGTTTGSDFGTSVALGEDLLVVGEPSPSSGAGGSGGTTYVYERIGGVWTETAILLSSLSNGLDEAGFAVAVQDRTIFVGEPATNTTGFRPTGAVVIYEDVGGAWVEQQILQPQDAIHEESWFGYSIDVQDDWLFVGARYHDNANGALAGAVYVYQLQNDVWIQTQLLIASDGTDTDIFGYDVDVDEEGQLLVVGAEMAEPEDIEDAGAAYVFRLTNGAWIEEAVLFPDDATETQRFGAAVAIEDSTVLVGAPENFFLSPFGAAYAFVETESGWVQTHKLQPGIPLTNSAKYGTAVVIADDLAMISADSLTVGAESSRGTVWAHSLSGAACKTLAAERDTLSVSEGGRVPLYLTAGDEFADAWYWIAGSTSGTDPGTMLGTARIPLIADAYFLSTVAVEPVEELRRGRGRLDGSGRARAQLSAPAGGDLALVGTTLHYAFAVVDRSPVVPLHVSNVVTVSLVQ